jgi:acyl-homoserine lactone acylase PvdQ
LVGTTGRVSWGITNPIVDVSDLYYETLNERGTHYMLDGEWKELKSVVHEIKVSGGKT